MTYKIKHLFCSFTVIIDYQQINLFYLVKCSLIVNMISDDRNQPFIGSTGAILSLIKLRRLYWNYSHDITSTFAMEWVWEQPLKVLPLKGIFSIMERAQIKAMTTSGLNRTQIMLLHQKIGICLNIIFATKSLTQWLFLCNYGGKLDNNKKMV